MTRDLVADVHGNFVHAFELLAQHTPRGALRRFDGVTAAMTGAGAAWFNPVFVHRPGGDIAAALEWASERGHPFAVHVRVGGDVVIEGLQADEGTTPGMVLDLIPDVPAPTGIAIREVTDAREWDLVEDLTARGFGLTVDLVAEVFTPSLLGLPGVAWYVGEVDGEPMGTAVLIRTGDVAGVFNIGVVEEHRRRGYGEALTWHVVRAGREAGCEVAVLEASAMGQPVYERMGFRTVVEYRSYVG